MERNQLIQAMREEGVLDVETILPDNTVCIAATEILFTRYKHNLYGTNIGNAPEVWCSLNGTEATTDLIAKIRGEVKHLYNDSSFRQKVFRSMHDHEAKSWK